MWAFKMPTFIFKYVVVIFFPFPMTERPRWLLLSSKVLSTPFLYLLPDRTFFSTILQCSLPQSDGESWRSMEEADFLLPFCFDSCRTTCKFYMSAVLFLLYYCPLPMEPFWIQQCLFQQHVIITDLCYLIWLWPLAFMAISILSFRHFWRFLWLLYMTYLPWWVINYDQWKLF